MIPIYGHSQLSREQPFVVQESDVYWSIEGTLPEDVKGRLASTQGTNR